MITPGQTLENPVTGERFTFTDTAASTGGTLLAFELALPGGGSVPIAHVHPNQTETFEILSGQMRFRAGWRTFVAGPGEVVVIEPGVAHAFANPTDRETTMRVEVRPALTMEHLFADVIAMARAGRMTRRGLPRDPVELALLARRYDEVAHAPLLGLGLQRALLAPLVRLGRPEGRYASRRKAATSSSSSAAVRLSS